jgi:hypothetical protein
MEEIFYMGGGGRKHHLLEGSEASPALPSSTSSKKMKIYEEDVRMVKVVKLYSQIMRFSINEKLKFHGPYFKLVLSPF